MSYRRARIGLTLVLLLLGGVLLLLGDKADAQERIPWPKQFPPRHSRSAQVHGHEPGHIFQIQADLAQARGITGSPSVVVAILDSGVNRHPDFNHLLVPGYNAVDRNEYDTSDKVALLGGHGTLVAGAIHSVCKDCGLRPVVVGDDFGISTDAAVRGIRYAADQNDRIINISWAGSTYSQALCEAVAYAQSKGSLVVAAGPNFTDQPLGYPGGCNANVLVVSGTNMYDLRVSGLVSGIDIAAPSEFVYTTGVDNNYVSATGTSFAAPQVSGAAGLVASVNPTLSALQIAQQTVSSADNISTSPQSQTGQDHEPRLNVAVLFDLVPRPVIVGLEPTSSFVNRQGGTVQLCVTARRANSVSYTVWPSTGTSFERTPSNDYPSDPTRMQTFSLNRFCGSFALKPNEGYLRTFWLSAYADNAIGRTYSAGASIDQGGLLTIPPPRLYMPLLYSPPSQPSPIRTPTSTR